MTEIVQPSHEPPKQRGSVFPPPPSRADIQALLDAEWQERTELPDPPSVEHLLTENDTPVDNIYSERQQRLLVGSLYASWQGPGDGRPYVALANVGFYYGIHDLPMAPNVMVSMDAQLPEELWEKRHRAYTFWEYGKAPELVIEIASSEVGDIDTEKLRRYRRMAVAYYVFYDPGRQLSQRLRIFSLSSIDARELEDAWISGIGLGMTLWQGQFEGAQETWLRWRDAQGNLLLTGEERAAQAQQVATRAQQEAVQAQQEATRAQQEAAQAQQENARLRARLQALGIDPDEPIDASG